MKNPFRKILAVLIISALSAGIISAAQADTITVSDVNSPTARWTFDQPYVHPAIYGVREIVADNGTYDLIMLSTDTNMLCGSITSTSNCATDNAKLGDSINISQGGSIAEHFRSRADFNTAYTDDFTISAWIKFNQLPTSDVWMFGHSYNVSTQYGWFVKYNQTSNTFDFYGSESTVVAPTIKITGSTTLAIDTWYNIIVVQDWDGISTNNIYMYLNGTQEGSTSTLANALANPATEFIVLGDIPLGDVDVIFDDISFYNSTLNASNIAALAAQTQLEVADFLFRSDWTLTNASTLLTEYQVGFEVDWDALNSLGFIDATIDDAVTTSESDLTLPFVITSNTPLSGSSYVFTRVPIIFSSADTDVRIYTGLSTSNQIRDRHQRFIFTGDDNISIADHASLDITGAFSISATGRVITPSSGTGYFINKWDSNQGYSFGINSSNQLVVRIDGNTYTSPVRSTVENTYGMYWDGSVVQILEGSEIIYSDAAAVTLTANAQPLVVGNSSLNADIGSVILRDESTPPTADADDLVKLTFDTSSFTQTQEGNGGNSWTWIGTLVDQSANAANITATYTIVADMSNITPTNNGVTILVGASLTDPVQQQSQFNIIGTVTGIATGTPTVNQGFPFRNIVDTSETTLGITDGSLWYIFVYGVGLMVAVGSLILLQTPFISITILNLAVLMGGLTGLYQPWLVSATIPMTYGIYAMDSLRRTGLT